MSKKQSVLRKTRLNGYKATFIEFRHHGKLGYTLVLTLARQNNCVLVQICADGKKRSECVEGALEMAAYAGIDLLTTQQVSSAGQSAS